MPIISREPCPKCREKGGDKRGNNLNVFDNGSKHCYACNHHVRNNGEEVKECLLPPHRPMPETGIQTRHIDAKTCYKYGVVNATDPDETEQVDGGYTPARTPLVIYPYYSVEDGTTLVGFKQINYSVPKGHPGRFLWFGESERATLYGANVISSHANNIVICEGENDTLAASQLLGSDYTVVGLSGTGMVNKLKLVMSVFRKYRRIYVCMDNDDAGRKAQREILDILPAGKTYIVNLPHDINDVNDMLMVGRGSEFNRCVRDAKQVLPKGIVDKADLKGRLTKYLEKRSELKGVSSGIPAIDYAIGGLVPGKLVTFAGGTGCGKSTIAENIAVNAAMEGNHTFILSLEMPDTQVAARMVQTILREPVASDPDFDITRIDPVAYELAVDTVLEHVHFYEHVGGLQVDTIIDVMNYAVDVYDCKLIVLDNFTSASDSLEWKDLEQLAKRVKNEVALARGTCVVAVSHISRDGDNEEKIPSLKHLRGGNGVAQQSDVVIGVGRKRDSKIIECRTIKTDRMTGRFVEFSLEFTNYKLLQVGFNDIPTSVDEDDEYEPNITNTHNDHDTSKETLQPEIPTPNGDTTERGVSEVPLRVRAESTRSDTVSGTVRTEATGIQTGEVLHAGHSTPERDIHRSEGLIQCRRQKEDESYKRATPKARHQTHLSTWLWDIRESSSSEERNVV
ncbi:DNA primase/helicase [Anabaena phage A-4L]|uniref:DNA primase/helicase n=1 Tax=Anabaena phage A-4L TaxID=1357732 RepID=A0A059PYD9_9CAUD|nr:DNA primase/helicase [Anabaena phage A-4L]AGR48543.1 DNA primase/helicase [Anabaena phage A-4L]